MKVQIKKDSLQVCGPLRFGVYVVTMSPSSIHEMYCWWFRRKQQIETLMLCFASPTKLDSVERNRCCDASSQIVSKGSYLEYPGSYFAGFWIFMTPIWLIMLSLLGYHLDDPIRMISTCQSQPSSQHPRLSERQDCADNIQGLR